MQLFRVINVFYAPCTPFLCSQLHKAVKKCVNQNLNSRCRYCQLLFRRKFCKQIKTVLTSSTVKKILQIKTCWIIILIFYLVAKYIFKRWYIFANCASLQRKNLWQLICKQQIREPQVEINSTLFEFVPSHQQIRFVNITTFYWMKLIVSEQHNLKISQNLGMNDLQYVRISYVITIVGIVAFKSNFR